MELGILASTAVILLRESFPYVRDLAGEAATAALKKVAGEKGKEWAEAVGLLKKKVEEDPVASALTGVLQEEPESEDAIESLRDQLRKLLERDEALRTELASRLTLTQAGEGGLANAGDLNAAQVATGGGNTQIHIGTMVVSVDGADAGGSEPLPNGHRNAYLRWVMAETADVRLSGVDPSVATSDRDKHLRLARVYTALRTTTPRQDPRELDGGAAEKLQRAPGKQALPQHTLQLWTEPPIPALEQLDRHPKLALLGQPGGGKSTFVDFVAHCLAGEALGDPRANLERLTAPLPQDDGSEGEEPQPWSHGALLPVRITLRDVAAKIVKTAEEICADDLLTFVLDGLSDAALEPCRRSVEDALRQGEALVLLDGLDEVPEAKDRRRAICRLVESFVAAFSECRFVVTTRTYAYQHHNFRLKGFETVELAPFGDGQIRRFVRGWYEHVAEQKKLKENDAKGRAVLLERAIFSSDRLRDFAERPLLLTLMASLHSWRGGSLPRDRQRLYSDTVELLLDVWEGQRRETDTEGRLILEEPSLTEYLKTERGELLQVLCELAFEAHRAQPETVGTADISARDLVAGLMDLRGRNAEDVNPKELARYLSQRAGILEERGSRVYTFPHRTFQEYLAARHLTESGFDLDEIAALGRRDPNRWREVVLLAAAALGTVGTWELADSLAFESEGDDAGEVSWGLHLAGHTLAESANLQKVSARNRRRLDGVRHRMATLLQGPHLPPTERALAGDHLGKLGDPRFTAEPPHLPADEMAGFLEVPDGPYIMGSTEADLAPFKEEHEDAWKHFYTTETPRHSVELTAFFLARHPVTTAQFRAFVDATGHEIGDRDAFRGDANRPVVMVSWHEAMAYCSWLTEQLRKSAPRKLDTVSTPEAARLWEAVAGGALHARLPSEAEWEAAARGTEGRIYPWGDAAPTTAHANYSASGLGGPSPVGLYAEGRGPFGHEDQAGNVLEWCLDGWEDKAYENREGSLNPIHAETQEGYRVFRGGSWLDVPWYLRAAYRGRDWSRYRSDYLGFRVLLGRFPEP